MSSRNGLCRAIATALMLCACLASAAKAQEDASPIMARLEVLSAPKCGGGGQVIWAGIADLAPQSAELALTVTPPEGLEPQRSVRPLALRKGEAADLSLPVATPAPGRYLVQAVLTLIANGRTWTDEQSLTLDVQAPAETGFAAASAAGAPVISQVRVENTFALGGVNYVFNRQLRLTSACAGAPTEYMISESSRFAGARWRPYRSAIDYAASAGNGTKTLYFKVRNAGKVESDAATLGVNLFMATELAPNGKKISANLAIAGENDWFYIKVATAGSYRIETECQSLKDSLTTTFEDFTDYTNPLGAGYFERGGKRRMVSFYFTPYRSRAKYYFIRIQARSFGSTGSYTVRLTQQTGLKLKTFSLAGGAETATSRDVSCALRGIGKPVAYKISESPVFDGADWQTFKAKTPRSGLKKGEFYTDFRLTLSSGIGEKAVYCKVRDKDGFASNVMVYRINLDYTNHLQIDGAPVNAQLSNASAQETDFFTFRVDVTGNYWIDCISEAPGFNLTVSATDNPSGGNMYEYSSRGGRIAPALVNLHPGVYFIAVSNWAKSGGGYVTGPYSISVAHMTDEPLVSWVRPFDDQVYAVTRQVQLSYSTQNEHTEYQASESPTFAGAAWTAVTDATPPRLQLSAGEGTKMIYFKVRDAQGRVSNTVSASVRLYNPPELAINQPERLAQFLWNGSGPETSGWFVFRAPSRATYIFETSASGRTGDIQDSWLVLYQPSAQGTLTQLDSDDDSGSGYYSRISMELDPGLYYVRVKGFGSREGYFKVKARLAQ